MYPKKNNFIIRLLVNATMANLNENDAIDRVKRGSLNFQVSTQTVSATKKNFIVAQIKTLYKGVSYVHKRGKIAGSLRHSYFTFFLIAVHLNASLLTNMPFS